MIKHLRVKPRRGTALVVVSLLALVTLAACGGGEKNDRTLGEGWDQILEKANEEGKVTLYGVQTTPVLESIEAAFEKKYPEIDLTFVKGTAGDLMPRIEAERQTGKAEGDVYVTADAATTLREDKAGLYKTVVGPSFDDAAYDRATYAPNGTYFEASAIVFGYGWNTDLVPNGLASMNDVIQDSYGGGKIGLPEPAFEAVVTYYQYMEEQFGSELFAKLPTLSPRIYPSSAPLAEALVSGEISVTPYASLSNLKESKANGAPVEYALPETPWGAQYYGVVLDGPNPNAAQVLADFLVSKEGQAATVAGQEDQVAVLADIPDSAMPYENVRRSAPMSADEVRDYFDNWKSTFRN